jgi:hypothetical protein
VATIARLTEERDWFKAEMERFMLAAAANHARAVLADGGRSR